MRTSRLWIVALLAVLAGGVAGAAATLPAAHAAPRCDGVWVVVDATELGGSLTTRCAEGDPSSGLGALEAVGHSYTFVPRVPGMVCTIDQRPDPCNGAPSDAYWSYWHADEGGSWTYASRGAGERDPKPGTVEGWAFGAGDRPGTSPPESAPSASGEDTSASESSSGPSGSSGSSGRSGSSDASGSPEGSSDSSSGSSGSTGPSSSDSGATSSSDDGESAPSSTADTPASDEEAGTAVDDTETGDTDTGDTDTGDGESADQREGVEEDEVQRRGTGADADDVLAGRQRGDDEDDVSPDREDVDREDADEVAIGAPASGDGSWLGVATGTVLAGSLAGAAVWRARRRNAATSEPWTPGS